MKTELRDSRVRVSPPQMKDYDTARMKTKFVMKDFPETSPTNDQRLVQFSQVVQVAEYSRPTSTDTSVSKPAKQKKSLKPKKVFNYKPPAKCSGMISMRQLARAESP